MNIIKKILNNLIKTKTKLLTCSVNDKNSKTLTSNTHKVISDTFETISPVSNNFIKITKNKYNNSPYKFNKLIFIQNEKIIIEEENTIGCLLCTVNYGQSVHNIIGRNDRLEYGELFKEFCEPFENYFLIFIKAVYDTNIYPNRTIINPYNFYTVVIHNNKIIEQKPGRTDISLINTKNELLWTSQFKTKEKIIWINCNKYINVNGLFEFNKYINECTIRKNNYVLIYFHRRECLAFYMVYEICKSAESLNILPNKFEDDVDTINYCAKFSSERVDDIAFIHYCLDKRGIGKSAYFKNLYGSKNKGYGCAGSAIYGIPFAEYIKGLNWTVNCKSQFMLSDEQKNNFKELVRFIYNKYDLKLDYTKLPESFITDLVFEDDFLNKLSNFVQNHYYCSSDYRIQKEEILKHKYNELKQKLIKNNIYSTKWKSEVDLFKLIYSHYTDAIYQYRSAWLGMQSIDIYVPSKKLAFEYQGQQHYEPIGIWGGEEGLKKRQKLDEQKRQLCKENNVKLIEWRYDEPISKIILKKKIGILYE